MKNIREEFDIKDFDKNVYRVLKSIKRDAPRIIIQGGYGKNNLGDDALLIVLYNKLKKWFPKSQIIAMCHFPDNVEQMYHIQAVGFKSKKMIKSLLWCDALIIGGGGIVNVVNTYSGFRYLKLLDMKGKFLFLSSLAVKARRKKVIFYGVGMTSIPDEIVRFLMKITLKKADLVGVRDPVSYKKAEKYLKDKRSLYITYDPALDYRGSDPENESQKGKKIIISIRAVPDSEVTAAVGYVMVELINSILENKSDVRIILLPVSCHPDKTVENDVFVCRKIYEEVCKKTDRVMLIDSYLKPQMIQKLLGEASVIVMTRLHGVILSYDFHIPTVIISYNEKVRLFGEMAGYPYIYEYYDLDKDQVISTVNKLLDEG